MYGGMGRGSRHREALRSVVPGEQEPQEGGSGEMDQAQIDLAKRQPLYDRDARIYEPPASYAYDPPVTAQEILDMFRASQNDSKKPPAK